MSDGLFSLLIYGFRMVQIMPLILMFHLTMILSNLPVMMTTLPLTDSMAVVSVTSFGDLFIWCLDTSDLQTSRVYFFI